MGKNKSIIGRSLLLMFYEWGEVRYSCFQREWNWSRKNVCNWASQLTPVESPKVGTSRSSSATSWCGNDIIQWPCSKWTGVKGSASLKSGETCINGLSLRMASTSTTRVWRSGKVTLDLPSTFFSDILWNISTTHYSKVHVLVWNAIEHLISLALLLSGQIGVIAVVRLLLPDNYKWMYCLKQQFLVLISGLWIFWMPSERSPLLSQSQLQDKICDCGIDK